MLIDRIIVYALSIPFKMAFRHARKRGHSAESLVVQVHAGSVIGHGEGAPRVYVTGEDLSGACIAVKRMAHHQRFPWKISSLAEIRDFIASTDGDGAENAARCALETALIDGFARASGIPAVDFFPSHHRAQTIRYGATIPLTSIERISHFCRMMNEWEIAEVRVKLGTDLKRNGEALRTVRRICGSGCDLRVDVNGVWDINDFLSHLPIFDQTFVRIVEQPFAPGDPALAEAAFRAEQEGIMMMADEEACNMAQVEHIIEEGHYRMVNVRLSKCGGIHGSLSIVERLREAGVTFQIGCQLGESGVLSAVGRALGLLCGDARYHDGSYDAFLLEENITNENVSFGLGGEAGPLGGPGFGAEVLSAQLVRLSAGRPPLEIIRQ